MNDAGCRSQMTEQEATAADPMMKERVSADVSRSCKSC